MPLRRPSPFAAALGLACAATAWPLWSGHYLPLVDLPQHLHLINVLGHLDDSQTLYPEFFQPRGQLTPYLGYYYAVWMLAKVFGLFTANQLFLTLVAVATPVSIAALLKSLGRSPWLALLACPLFYGDNFYWGFINYCAALPLLFFSMAMFIDTLEAPPDPKYRREIGLGLLLVSVQLMHIQAFFFAGLALPLLLLMTPSDRVHRLRAIGAALPGALFFAIYSIGRLGDKPDVAPGAPWHAWGPIFSKQNLTFNPVDANWAALPDLLANGFKDGSDRPVVNWLMGAAAFSLVAALGSWLQGQLRTKGTENKKDDASKKKEAAKKDAAPSAPPPNLELKLKVWVSALRGPALAVLALLMFLFLPFDINGYIYYLNNRFAQLFALLVITAIPLPRSEGLRKAVGAVGLGIAVVYGFTLASHFRDFDREANSLDTIDRAVPPRSKIAAMSFDPMSAIATHPTYLHAASYTALQSGGISSFSFASTPHSPLAYRAAAPPAPASEWRPDLFDFARYGSFYDFFLVRGRVPPQYVFHGMQNQVAIAAQSGAFTLYRRVTEPAATP